MIGEKVEVEHNDETIKLETANEIWSGTCSGCYFRSERARKCYISRRIAEKHDYDCTKGFIFIEDKDKKVIW